MYEVSELVGDSYNRTAGEGLAKSDGTISTIDSLRVLKQLPICGRSRIENMGRERERAAAAAAMIYDVNSPLFRSFLSQKGGSSDKRVTTDTWGPSRGEKQRTKETNPIVLQEYKRE
ncbi:hypothetical protein RJ639_006409 [Escallonia herrerae]|uniref:Uncharacterized protein n=1 Tax=Escallonia herrerae TaxID=1293975 RepID=A0AA89AUL2_9ASTE|nr:hypothetical protein RJ639_006409 [Escallonia herrerae]